MAVPGDVDTSIVILTKNGGALLRRCLEAIFGQDYPDAFEVILVDSGSTDGTLDVVGEFPVRLHTIDPKAFNFGEARDLGFSLAKGRWIVTLSQDVVPATGGWLRALVEPFSDPVVAAVQGNCILPEPADEVFYWWRTGNFYFTSEVGKWTRRYGFGLSHTCSAVRRDAWESARVGPLPMGEDRMLQRMLAERGHRFAYAYDATAYHGHAYPTLRGLMHRCENEGLGCRCVGLSYSVLDVLRDLLNLRMYRILIRALRHRMIRRPSEILFPFVRPMFLFKGNHFGKRYKP